MICHLCRQFKHYKCSGLTKKDVEAIINTPNYKWSCYDCISAALPINACSPITSRTTVDHTLKPHKIRCHSCDGMSYRKNTVSTCPWCANISHNKCFKGALGCLRCCDEIIPGNHYHAYELLDVGTRVLIHSPRIWRKC